MMQPCLIYLHVSSLWLRTEHPAVNQVLKDLDRVERAGVRVGPDLAPHAKALPLLKLGVERWISRGV